MTVRPTPESYIPEFSALEEIKDESDLVTALECLVSIGGSITAYAASDVSVGFGRINPYFHNDLKNLFSTWRGIARQVLRRNKDILKEEYEMLEYSDSVPSQPLAKEDPDFDSPYAINLIKDIQSETLRRLETLRVARKKAKEVSLAAMKRNSPASFDEKTGTLIIKGESFVIAEKIKKGSLGTLQYRMLFILFDTNEKALPCDEFWPKWRGRIAADYVSDKRAWHTIFDTADDINTKVRIVTGDNDLIEVTKDFISIAKTYK